MSHTSAAQSKVLESVCIGPRITTHIVGVVYVPPPSPPTRRAHRRGSRTPTSHMLSHTVCVHLCTGWLLGERKKKKTRWDAPQSCRTRFAPPLMPPLRTDSIRREGAELHFTAETPCYQYKPQKDRNKSLGCTAKLQHSSPVVYFSVWH